jgi:hypothetical protein
MKFKYTLDLLESTIERDSAVLISTHDSIQKRTIIQFRCQCGEENQKTAERLIRQNGAFCKKCALIRGIEKTKSTNTAKTGKKEICNVEALHDVIQRDEAELLDEYKAVTINTIIHFRCKCNAESEKNCMQLIKVSGAFCTKCTRTHWTQRTKETNMNRYGVECTVHYQPIKEQIIQSNLEKYGVKHLFESKEIREQIKETMIQKYGVDSPMKSDEIKNKIKESNIKKYGVENTTQLDEVKEKMKNTLLERYGVDHYSKTDEYKEKMKDTCLNKYGVEHYSKTDEYKEQFKNTCIAHYGVVNPNKAKEVRDKIKQTCLSRYGVEYSLQAKEIQDKIKQTCLKRYGVENSSQAQEVQEKIQKSGKKYKEYKMPSGQVRKVQGYEPFALDELVTQFSEDDILTDRKEVPQIQYIANDKNRLYFPDIYIKSINKIIEVKSDWTYKSKVDNIKEKENATKEAGYNYEIWVYTKKGEKVVME